MSASAGSSRRTLLLNAIVSAIGFATQLGVAFFMSPLLVHGLGDRRNGIWSLVESVLAYLMLFDLGVAASVVRYVARFEAQRDAVSLNRIFNTSLCIFAAAGAIAFAIAAGIAWFALGWFAVPADLSDEARWMLTLLGLNLALGLPLSVFPSALDGLGRFPIKTALRTVSLLVRSVLYVAILQAGGGLIDLAWAITACTAAEHLAMALAAWWYLPALRLSLRLVDRATFREIRGYSLDAFLAMLAGRISFQTDALVIGAFLGPQYITFFGIGAKLVEQAKGSLRAVTTVLTPAFSAWEARGEEHAIRRMFLDGTRWVLWLILPLQVGLLLLGRPFLDLWMGERYVALCYPTMALLALPLSLAMAQSISGRVLYGVGRLRWFSRAVMIEAAANLVLSVALVSPLGIEGVALGTALPNAVCNVAVALYVCRILNIDIREYLLGSCAKPFGLAGGLAVFWLALGKLLPATNWAMFVLLGACGVAAYLPCAALLELGWRNLLPAAKEPGYAASKLAG